jgi:hypothetical protein
MNQLEFLFKVDTLRPEVSGVKPGAIEDVGGGHPMPAFEFAPALTANVIVYTGTAVVGVE